MSDVDYNYSAEDSFFFFFQPQEILTKDSVTVTVDVVVYFRVFDPVATVTKVENGTYSARLLAATTLRNTLGKLNKIKPILSLQKYANISLFFL